MLLICHLQLTLEITWVRGVKQRERGREAGRLREKEREEGAEEEEGEVGERGRDAECEKSVERKSDRMKLEMRWRIKEINHETPKSMMDLITVGTKRKNAPIKVTVTGRKVKRENPMHLVEY